MSLLLTAAGCSQQNRAGMTCRCGVEALAAGSPKSAIPFLSQVVAADPQSTEPRGMLARAYALDLQPDLAIRQARLVRRHARTDSLPGWETMALGIAAICQHDPTRASEHFKKIRSASNVDGRVKCAAAQWLTLALLLTGDDKAALDLLSRFGQTKNTRTTALLWSVLIHGRKNNKAEAAKALSQVAAEALGYARLGSLQTLDLTNADDQDLCDAAIAALGQGELESAATLFTTLHERNANARDAQVWLALTAAAQGKWQEARDRLKNGCHDGPLRSRSLAHQLFSVICALESRPHAMIQHLLTGRRMAGRRRLHIHVPDQPEPDPTWLSSHIK